MKKTKSYEYHDFSGIGHELICPEGATGAFVRGRHSDSVQHGSDMIRGLKRNGIDLCRRVSPAYHDLMEGLCRLLGTYSFYRVCSRCARSRETTNLVFPDLPVLESSDEQSTLNPFRLRDLPDPDGDERGWRKVQEARGKTKPELLDMLGRDQNLLGFEAAQRYVQGNKSFMTAERWSSQATISFDHEDGLSVLAAHCGLPMDQLNLRHCEAFVFFVAKGEVLAVQRFSMHRGGVSNLKLS